MNLGEIGENGKLNVVQNVNELHDIWQELKEDEKPKESTQNETEKIKKLKCTYVNNYIIIHIYQISNYFKMS